MLELRIYRKADGAQPLSKWLDDLRDVQARGRIRARLTRLAAGNAGDAKSIGGGLMELRIDHGPGYRVYLAKRGEVLVLLLCGGDKHSQATDIQTARLYFEDWKKRGKP